MSDIRIPVEVRISEQVEERAWHATLPNGKMILAYLRKSAPLPSLRAGDRCTVHLSLCDFDHGKIVAVPSGN